MSKYIIVSRTARGKVNQMSNGLGWLSTTTDANVFSSKDEAAAFKDLFTSHLQRAELLEISDEIASKLASVSEKNGTPSEDIFQKIDDVEDAINAL